MQKIYGSSDSPALAHGPGCKMREVEENVG